MPGETSVDTEALPGCLFSRELREQLRWLYQPVRLSSTP
jgi:hypothetical protein